MGVPMRMRLSPLPCIANHRSEVGLGGNPAQFVPNLLAGSNQDGWISSTAGSFNSSDGPPGDFACRLNHIAYREAHTVSKVIDAVLSGTDTVQRKQVGTRQVLDVNIVTDRRSIGCGIVRSVDLNLGTLPECPLKYNRDKMCLRMVILS
jgi:hypothetical protein